MKMGLFSQISFPKQFFQLEKKQNFVFHFFRRTSKLKLQETSLFRITIIPPSLRTYTDRPTPPLLHTLLRSIHYYHISHLDFGLCIHSVRDFPSLFEPPNQTRKNNTILPLPKNMAHEREKKKCVVV